MSRTNYFGSRQILCLMIGLCLVLPAPLVERCLATENESAEHYKMLSSVQYTGNGQFRSEVETLFTVRKQPLSGGKVQYFLSADAFGLVGDSLNSGQQSSFKELSFVIDGKTQHLSEFGEDLAFLGKVSNECLKSLKKVTKKNTGRTWKQSLDLSTLGNSLPSELKFTLTAIQLKTEAFGEAIAVRALSEPFFVEALKEEGVGTIESRINAVYLFDQKVEDIYLSISVFKATTTTNGIKETLWHQVATCKTDATGVTADFSRLGNDKEFAKLVSKLGLTKNSFEVIKGSHLPEWIRSEGLRAAQAANICAATACEGALNPVAGVCIPAARMAGIQIITSSLLVGTGAESGVRSLDALFGFEWFGWNLTTALFVGGTTVGVLAATGAFEGEGRPAIRSPYKPPWQPPDVQVVP